MVDLALVRMAEMLPGGLSWSMPSFLSRPTRVWFIPDEPTTLALALIGAGILAVYALASRYLRPASSSGEGMRRSGAPSETQQPAGHAQRKRGAA